MRRTLVILMLVTLAPRASGEAQTPQTDRHESMASRFVDRVNGLTLEQAIQQALDGEPGLRAVRSDVDAARGMSAQAALKPNPTVTFSQLTEPAGTDAQTRVDVQWPLDLFRKTGRVNVADREVEAIKAATADRERLVIADVRMKFGEVLAAVRELSVTDELVAVTSSQHALMAARAEAGAIPPLERDMIRVELQRLEADRMLEAGHVEHALIELKRLLGLRADVPLTLRDELEELVARETAAALPAPTNTKAASRPDVGEAEARVHAADARIDQARREGRFDVSLFGMYMRMDSGFAQRGFGPENDLERVRGVFHNIGAGVMVSVPLRDRKQGDVAAAEALRVGAEAQLEARRLTAQAEIAAARARDEHARRALALYASETRDLAKRNLDVVSQTYEVGRMTLFDVLNERRRYVDTERAYTNALREAYNARQALRTALGEVR
jgi:cobalt-zinc-cadmium efflux system outer membrane protein